MGVSRKIIVDRPKDIFIPTCANCYFSHSIDIDQRPGGNATGINFFLAEVVAKRLQLLHDLVPKAVRIAVLVNLGNASAAESAIRDLQEAAPAIGLQIQIILNATTIGEIDAAFAALARERPDALFVAPDGFLDSRRAQFATLAAREDSDGLYDP